MAAVKRFNVGNQPDAINSDDISSDDDSKYNRNEFLVRKLNRMDHNRNDICKLEGYNVYEHCMMNNMMNNMIRNNSTNLNTFWRFVIQNLQSMLKTIQNLTLNKIYYDQLYKKKGNKKNILIKIKWKSPDW